MIRLAGAYAAIRGLQMTDMSKDDTLPMIPSQVMVPQGHVSPKPVRSSKPFQHPAHRPPPPPQVCVNRVNIDIKIAFGVFFVFLYGGFRVCHTQRIIVQVTYGVFAMPLIYVDGSKRNGVTEFMFRYMRMFL